MAKDKVDWEGIEREYRAGQLTLAEIGTLYGVTKGRISQVATRDRWERDLSARIQAKAEAKLAEALVNAELNSEGRELKDDERVEVGAKVISGVVLGHRDLINRYRKLAQKLLGEIESTSDNLELFDQLGELLRSENERGVDKLNDAYRKVIELPGRVDAFKKLADVLKILIGLERQAFGMADTSDGNKNPPEAPPLVGTASINDAARRIAFMFMSATHQGGKQP